MYVCVPDVCAWCLKIWRQPCPAKMWVLGTEFKSSTALIPHPTFFFQTGCHYVAQAGFELETLLSLPLSVMMSLFTFSSDTLFQCLKIFCVGVSPCGGQRTVFSSHSGEAGAPLFLLCALGSLAQEHPPRVCCHSSHLTVRMLGLHRPLPYPDFALALRMELKQSGLCSECFYLPSHLPGLPPKSFFFSQNLFTCFCFSSNFLFYK